MELECWNVFCPALFLLHILESANNNEREVILKVSSVLLLQRMSFAGSDSKMLMSPPAHMVYINFTSSEMLCCISNASLFPVRNEIFG